MHSAIIMSALIAAVLSSGCATGGAAIGPNGRPLFHIETVGATSAYNKAAERCPNGYNILTSRQQGLFFVMDVECR